MKINAEAAKAKSIFLNALEHCAPDEMASFLDRECEGNDELRRQVDRLLGGHRKDMDLVQHGEAALKQVFPTLDQLEISARPGTQIGPYKLREQIGEGGFGTVYVAEQEKPVARKVALKVIKPGMDTRAVVARFEAERQALAMMDHPNIARVLDAGATEAGRPYFVMELAKGASITEFCDAHKLGTRERLQLFVEVCKAVQHAHQKGIIHRDLKPSNVMVTMRDDRPIPKVIDFGVAKALSQKLTEKTVYTGYGQLIGTPLYMSPEQAQMNEVDVDTRSDVYSLGILLYELLTGTTPFNGETIKQASFDELRRIIREDEPPRPSDRISTLRAEQISTISDQRKIDAGSLARSLRGELDWIVMKALEKDRNRRYESASAFAADVERHLNDEPVQACPPSVWYQLKKLGRRHKGMVTAVSLGLLLVASIGGGVGWVASESANRQRLLAAKAEQALTELDWLEDSNQWEEALRVAKHAQSLLGSDEANGEFKTQVNADVKDLSLIVHTEQTRLRKANWAMSQTRFADQVRRRLREYESSFAAWGVKAEETSPESAAALIRSMKPNRRHAVNAALYDWAALHVLQPSQFSAWKNPNRSSPVFSWLDATLSLTSDYHQTGFGINIDQGKVSSLPPAYVCATGVMLRLKGETSRATALLEEAAFKHPTDFWINVELSNVYESQDRLPESIRCLERALAIRQTSWLYHNLGNDLLHAGQPEAAIQSLQKALQFEPENAATRWHLTSALRLIGRLNEAEMTIRDLIEEEPSANAHFVLASVLHDQGKLEQAEAECRRALILEDGSEFHTLLGTILARMSRLEEALEEYENARTLDPDSWSHYSNIGNVLQRMNRVEGAIRAFEESIKRNPSRPGDYNAVGALYANSGRNKLALKYFMDAYRLSAASPQWSPDFKASVCCNLGLLLCMQGEYHSGLEMFRQAIHFDPDYHDALTNLSWELATSTTAALRDPEAAIKYAERAVGLAPQNGNDWGNLGTAFVSAGKWEQAREAFEKADQLKQGNCDHCFHSAMAYWQLGSKVRARREFDRAVTWMEQNNPHDEELRSFREQAELLLGVRRADE